LCSRSVIFFSSLLNQCGDKEGMLKKRILKKGPSFVLFRQVFAADIVLLWISWDIRGCSLYRFPDADPLVRLLAISVSLAAVSA